MSKKPKQIRLSREDRRKQLIDRGIEMFGAYPYDELTAQDIGEHCGISPGLLYQYFDGKHGFFIACMEVLVDALIDRTQMPNTGNFAHDFHTMIYRFVTFLDEHHGSASLLLRGSFGNDPALEELTDSVRQHLISQALGAVGLDNDPSPILKIWVKGIVNFAEGIALEWIDNGKQAGVKAEQIADIAHMLVQDSLIRYHSQEQ